MVAGYLVAGLVLGAVTGMPVGAVGVAVIDAAHRCSLRRAVAIGVGGGTGDMLYASVGVLAVGPALTDRPGLLAAVYAVSGAALIGFGASRLRARPRPPDARAPGRLGGFALGLALVVMNPASIVTWVVVVGGVTGGTSGTEAIALVAGVGLGSAAWFSCLAHMAHRGAQRLGERALWIPRIAGGLLVGYGLFSLGRGAHYWLS